jgi:hypothetical protein
MKRPNRTTRAGQTQEEEGENKKHRNSTDFSTSGKSKCRHKADNEKQHLYCKREVRQRSTTTHVSKGKTGTNKKQKIRKRSTRSRERPERNQGYQGTSK